MNTRRKKSNRLSREDLKEYRGRDTSDVIWHVLVVEKYLADHAASLESLSRKIAQLEQDPVLLGADAPPTGQRGRRAGGSKLRGDAISAVLAATARLEPSVIAFRRDHLSDHCLRAEQVGDWMRTTCEAHRDEAETLVEVHLRPGDFTRGTDGRIVLKSPVLSQRYAIKVDSLAYIVYEQWWLPSWSPCAGAAMRSLRELGAELSEKYGWSAAAAVTFVLTDIDPFLPSATVEAKVNAAFPAIARVDLSVDLLYTAKEVATMYGEQRDRLLGTGRMRMLSDKHVRLARYTAEKGLVIGMPPSVDPNSCMASWNQSHPADRYTKLFLFNRDWRHAQMRLLQLRIVDLDALPEMQRANILINEGLRKQPKPDRDSSDRKSAGDDERGVENRRRAPHLLPIA